MAKPFSVILSALLLSSLSLFLSSPVRAELTPPGPFEQVTTTTIPAVYSELFNAYGEKIKNSPDAAIKEISGKIDLTLKTLGRTLAVLDVGGKIYAGDNKEAAISAGLTLLGELAGSELGKAYLSAAGLTTAPVTAAIAAIQIYRSSEAELAKAQIGVSLETLYGSIESDPVLKNRNRALGTGEPIPVTAEAIEYVWRKVIFDNGWRRMFRVYVTDQLSQEWPEASFWQNLTTPGNRVEDAALLENADEYKSFIAGLLSSLNKLAKNREQRVLVDKHLTSLKERFSSLSSTSLLDKYAEAVKNLPKVEEFVGHCPELIQRGLQERSLGPLSIVIGSSRDYAKNVLAYIPNTGSVGQQRDQLLENLKEYYRKAWEAREAVKKILEREDRRLAEEQPVTVWRAKQVGFDLSFDSLDALVRSEYERNGHIQESLEKLSNAWDRVRADYAKQSRQVADDYQRRSESGDNLESEWKAFDRQLNAFMAIDQRKFAETSARVHELFASLEEQIQLRDQALDRQVNMLSQQLKGLQPVFSRIKSLRKAYHFSDQLPPASNYVGLVDFRLPGHPLPADAYNAYSFTSPHFEDLAELKGQLRQARKLTMADGARYDLAVMLPVMLLLDQYLQDLLDEKDAFSAFARAVQVFERELNTTRKPHSWAVTSARSQFDTQWNPFIEESSKAIEEATDLQGKVVKRLRSYTTDLEHLENDQDYLSQLTTTLGRLAPILTDFVARYQDRLQFSQGDLIFHPDRGGAANKGDCEQLTSKPVLMDSTDIATARQELKRQLADAGLIWLEEKHKLKISAFADEFFTRRVLYRLAKTPEAYAFIDSGLANRCEVILPAYFDSLASRVASIDKIDSFFPRNLQTALGFINGMQQGPRDNLKLLGIPRRDPTRDNPSVLDLDNLPEDHFSGLEHFAKLSWSDVFSASIRNLMTVFSDKLAAYGDWLAKEDYFEKVRSRCGTISGPLHQLEYEARTRYDQATLHGQGDLLEALPLYEQAAALRQPVIGCYEAAARDAGLSANRQDYMAAYIPGLEKQFHVIDAMVRTLRSSKAGRRQGAEPEQNAELVRSLYQKFQDAYQSKNESAVMALVDDQWSSVDGTTLFDLEENLHNMYNVFDDIQYQISDLSIQAKGDGIWQVSYRVSITGMIYENDLIHEEESQVTEQVATGDSGKARIIKTLAGQYWSMQ